MVQPGANRARAELPTGLTHGFKRTSGRLSSVLEVTDWPGEHEAPKDVASNPRWLFAPNSSQV